MPILQQHTNPLWGIWKIEETWEELLSMLTNQTSYQAFLQQSKSESRKAEWLAVRVLLKTLFNKEMSIDYHPNGVPFLPDSQSSISISHTKGYAAVALSAQKIAGIDIEYRSERVQKIYRRFLNDQELCLIGEHPETEQLLICWSAKETAFKMTQQESVDWQNDIQILSFDQANKNLTIQEKLTPLNNIYTVNYDVTSDYVLTKSFS